VLAADPPSGLTWSSIWVDHPDAVIRFDLAGRLDGGTDLRWTLLVEGAAPADEVVRGLQWRLNELVDADLRSTFAQ
jgi:hypothetical protein